MIKFILNDQEISTERPGGLSLLDFIRKEQDLYGTKIGCREGDCGACTVMEGRLINGVVKYKSIVSCLTPLLNVHATHIVTIEGLQMMGLSPVQDAMWRHGGTQCGFCTPGFVMSLTAHFLSSEKKDPLEAIAGNICRCTGYKSIERAAHELTDITMEWIPEYFSSIPQRLKTIESQKASSGPGGQIVGGGTDLMVQHYDRLRQEDAVSTEGWLPDKIEVKNGSVMVGGGVSIQSFFDSQIIRSALPRLQEVYPLIASRQIRNMGTLAGNIVNASPIGDLTIMLLALGAELMVENGSKDIRQIALRDFFLDYKRVDLKDGEIIKFIVFHKLGEDGFFAFEKVSKRKHLDIASVNSSISMVLENGVITHLGYAVGGVAPVPKYMTDTAAFLCGKKLETTTLKSAVEIMQAEISPISDIRGSKAYKRLLARQLFLQHFLSMFPDETTVDEII